MNSTEEVDRGVSVTHRETAATALARLFPPRRLLYYGRLHTHIPAHWQLPVLARTCHETNTRIQSILVDKK